MTTRQYPRKSFRDSVSQKSSRCSVSRKKKKTRSRRYAFLPALLLSVTLLLTAFLFWQLLAEQREGQKSVRMMAALPSGDISNELFLKIQDLPGLTHCWAVYGAQAEIRIGSYRASAEILGVDLSAWPFKITKSAGKKRLGSAPLLVAGEDFFQSLADEYGSPITKRQAQVFREKAETLDAEITLFSDTAGAAFSADETPAFSGNEPSAISLSGLSAISTNEPSDIPIREPSAAYTGGADPLSGQGRTASYSAAGAVSLLQDTLSSDSPSPAAYNDNIPISNAPVSLTGSFLALSDGGRLYMDAEQMRELLKTHGFSADLSRVCLEIQGKQNAEAAKKSLTKAGFLVDKAEF